MFLIEKTFEALSQPIPEYEITLEACQEAAEILNDPRTGEDLMREATIFPGVVNTLLHEAEMAKQGKVMNIFGEWIDRSRARRMDCNGNFID